MAETGSVPAQRVDCVDHPASYRRLHAERGTEARLIWEMPLGNIRGPLDEPGPRFVDVEGEADLEAARWERGISASGNGR